MAEADWLAERFEQNRTRLRAVAYRMLGSFTEAEDAVQEAWLRASKSDVSGVENLGAWLTTIVARVCLNAVRSRRGRREEPSGRYEPRGRGASRRRGRARAAGRARGADPGRAAGVRPA